MYSNSCPLSQWCYLAISSSEAPLSFCLQSFLTSGSCLSWLFTSGGQSIGALTSASVLPMNIQDWFPLGMTGLISLLSKGLSRVLYSTTVWKHDVFNTQPSLCSNSHPYMTTGKTIALTIQTFFGKVMSLLFNTLSRFVVAFLLRSESLLIHRCNHHSQWKQWKTIFLGSKITAYGDFSHETKRCLLLGRKVMTNVDNILKAEASLCQQRSI